MNSKNNSNHSTRENVPFIPEGKILVQFDGICILCNRTVKFILKVDRKRKFMFQSLQTTSDEISFDSVVVIDGSTKYHYFDAVLKIGQELGGIYKLIAVFKIIPRKWRNSLYRWVSENRFKWFGKLNKCYIPTSDEKERFI